MNQPIKNDDTLSDQMRDFDRWRRAVELVRQLREAGIDCKLGDKRQSGNCYVARETDDADDASARMTH